MNLMKNDYTTQSICALMQIASLVGMIDRYNVLVIYFKEGC